MAPTTTSASSTTATVAVAEPPPLEARVRSRSNRECGACGGEGGGAGGGAQCTLERCLPPPQRPLLGSSAAAGIGQPGPQTPERR